MFSRDKAVELFGTMRVTMQELEAKLPAKQAKEVRATRARWDIYERQVQDWNYDLVIQDSKKLTFPDYIGPAKEGLFDVWKYLSDRCDNVPSLEEVDSRR